MALQLQINKRLLSDGSTEGLVLSKALSPNLDFSFLSWISQLVISSSYPIVLLRLVDPVPDPRPIPEKFSRVGL